MHEAITGVYVAETSLGAELRSAAERHPAEADLFHLGRTLARGCDAQLRLLAPFAERYGVTPVDVVSTPETPADLMADLRRLYLAAHDAEIAWVVLLQGALAVRDSELVEVARECREKAQQRWQWVRTRIKETSPQLLVT
jgi:hypothetical protein